MKIINPYSFIIVALGIIAILVFFAVSRGIQTTGVLLALGAVVIGLIASFLILNPGASTVQDAEQITTAIGAGSPVLLEFQSPY
jgi:hypothetical protein